MKLCINEVMLQYALAICSMTMCSLRMMLQFRKSHLNFITMNLICYSIRSRLMEICCVCFFPVGNIYCCLYTLNFRKGGVDCAEEPLYSNKVMFHLGGESIGSL